MRHSWFQSQLTIHLLEAHLSKPMPVQVLESLEEQALPSKAKNSPQAV